MLLNICEDLFFEDLKDILVKELDIVICCGKRLLSNKIGRAIVSSIVSKASSIESSMIQQPRVSLRVSSRLRGCLPPLTSKNKTVIIRIVSPIIASKVSSMVATIQQPRVSLRVRYRLSFSLPSLAAKGKTTIVGIVSTII